MRRLNRSVVTGGVVYPAGTAGTSELVDKIPNPAHWDGEPSDDALDDALDEDRAGYTAWTKPELEAEIDRRNDDGRGEPIVVVGKGNKPDLIAALAADDITS